MLQFFMGVCLFFSYSSTILAQGIKFEKGTWETVLRKAQQENKPIFVDAYTTWCGPCKWMSKEVFTQEKVANYINTHFVAYKMDMEKGEGPAFAIANKVNAFPTLLYFDSQGLLLHKAAGARDADQLIQLCEDAMDPTKQVGSYHKRYKEGAKDQAFLKQYITVLAEAGEDFSEPFDLYWETLTEKEQHSEETLVMLAYLTEDFSDAESTWTTYFMENKATFAKNTDSSTVDYYMLQAYIYRTYSLAQMEENAATEAKKEHLLALFPEAHNEFKARWDFYRATLEVPPSNSKIERLRKRYLLVTIDMSELNEVAWMTITEERGSKKELKNALKYINRSVEIKADYYNLHIKAAILLKMRKNKQAIAVAKEALASAEALDLNEEETAATRVLLEKMGVKSSKLSAK